MKKPELTARLQTVADLIPTGSKVADIGTDHAYLPVWLLLNCTATQAIAADIRTGPLDRAKLTAQQYDCQNGLSFRLCDGLEGIAPEEADTIVIAGMGGETIAAILERAPWTANSDYTLILQPMSAQNDLRHWLWTAGYGIEQELLVQEGEKLYQILQVRFGNPEPLTLAEEWAGRQSPEQEQPLRTLLLTRLLEKTQRAINGISSGNGERNQDRLEQLHLLYQQLDAMKKEWDAWQQ